MKENLSTSRYDLPSKPASGMTVFRPGQTHTKSAERLDFWSPDKSIDSLELQMKLQKRLRNLNQEEIRRVVENPVTRKYIRLPDYSIGEPTLTNILGFKTKNMNTSQVLIT